MPTRNRLYALGGLVMIVAAVGMVAFWQFFAAAAFFLIGIGLLAQGQQVPPNR